jgi:hypothetical protein
VRYNKFPPLPNALAGDAHPNDFPIFRLSEMYLIKGEAQLALGNTGEALTNVNFVRARAFNPPKPLASSRQTSSCRSGCSSLRVRRSGGRT